MPPHKTGKRRIRNLERVMQALELRKTGATFEAIGRALVPPCSAPNAYGLVSTGIAYIREQLAAKAEDVATLELERLDAMFLQLWGQRKNPRTADSLLRIMERRAKILGLDRPVKVAATDPEGGALPPAATPLDYSKLSLEELRDLEALLSKAEAQAPTAAP